MVRDANALALAYVYCRATKTDAMQAKVLTEDEARRVAVKYREAAGAVAARKITVPLPHWK